MEPLVDKAGHPLSPYTYNFWLYSSLNRFIVDFNVDKFGTERDRTFFTIVEENG